MTERVQRYELRTPTSARLAAAAKAERRCSKQGCKLPGAVSMSYDYGNRTVFIGTLLPDRHPAFYDLCRVHLESLVPPRGWTLRRQPLASVGSNGPDWAIDSPPAPNGNKTSTG